MTVARYNIGHRLVATANMTIAEKEKQSHYFYLPLFLNMAKQFLAPGDGV